MTPTLADAADPTRKPSLLDPQLLWAMLALVVTLLLAALVLAWADRWRKANARPIANAADELTNFRLSYERGELSQQEYERIRDRLAPRVRRQFGAAEKPSPNATAKPPEGPPATEPTTPEGSES